MSIRRIEEILGAIRESGEYVTEEEKEPKKESKVAEADSSPSIEEQLKEIDKDKDFGKWKGLYTYTEDGVENYPQPIDPKGITGYKEIVKIKGKPVEKTYPGLIKTFKSKWKKGKKLKDQSNEVKQMNKAISYLQSKGYIDKNFNPNKEAMKKMADIDEHFRVAELLNPGKNEGAKRLLNHLKNFANKRGIELRLSSIYRDQHHEYSKGKKKFDHAKGRAVDVSRVKINGKEIEYVDFIAEYPELYRDLIDHMSKFYYINEKEWKHGHFADNPKMNKKKAARIGGEVYSENNPLYDKSYVPEDNPEVSIKDLRTLERKRKESLRR